ncbi:hypothetical protein EON68_05085, partial [archaeon]
RALTAAPTAGDVPPKLTSVLQAAVTAGAGEEGLPELLSAVAAASPRLVMDLIFAVQDAGRIAAPAASAPAPPTPQRGPKPNAARVPAAAVISKRAPPPMAAPLLNAALQACALHRHFAGAAAAWEALRTSKLRPSSDAADAWLRMLVDAGKAREALVIFERLLAAGAQPTAATLTALIDAHAACGDFQSVQAVWSLLTTGQPPEWNAVLPDVTCFNSYAAAAAAAGNRREALHVLDRMRRDSVAPNEATFTNCMLACAASRVDVLYTHARGSARLLPITRTKCDGRHGGGWLEAVTPHFRSHAAGCAVLRRRVARV